MHVAAKGFTMAGILVIHPAVLLCLAPVLPTAPTGSLRADPTSDPLIPPLSLWDPLWDLLSR